MNDLWVTNTKLDGEESMSLDADYSTNAGFFA